MNILTACVWKFLYQICLAPYLYANFKIPDPYIFWAHIPDPYIFVAHIPDPYILDPLLPNPYSCTSGLT